MKITSKQKAESLSISTAGFTANTSNGIYFDISINFAVNLKDMKKLEDWVRSKAELELLFKAEPLSGDALKWDGTTKGLEGLTKALGVAFMLAFNESTDEVMHFVVSGPERLHLRPGDYVAVMQDKTIKVLSHSDVTANYQIGVCSVS